MTLTRLAGLIEGALAATSSVSSVLLVDESPAEHTLIVRTADDQAFTITVSSSD